MGSVTVGAARRAAADWVARHAAGRPWFRGAYFAGSMPGLAEDARIDPASDLDVHLVTAEADPPLKPGKIVHSGALLDVSYIPARLVASAREVLGHYHLAGAFRIDAILADPSGELRRLQAEVARHFAEDAWVRGRCAHALGNSESRLRAIDAAAPWHEQVTAWLFGTGVTTHVVLVAALRNPTVRLRYLRAREVLAEYGRSDIYAEMLRLLGCADMPAARAEHHLAELAQTFDAAAAALRTPYSFGTDISASARPISIDGSRALIAAGDHREAVFWIVATFGRCHAVLATDAPDVLRARAPAFDALLADLGIGSTADLQRRAGQVLRFLPAVAETAEAIMAANPAVVR
jgi:hypothetical protein